MQTNTPPLYLPVSEQAARRLLDANTPPDGAIERAALFVAITQCNRQMAEGGAPNPMSHAAAMRLFSDALPVFAGDADNGAATLVAMVNERPRTVRQMRAILQGVNITFAPNNTPIEAESPDSAFDIIAFQDSCLWHMESCSVAFDRLPDADADEDSGERDARPRAPRMEFSGYRGQRVAAAVIAADRGERVYVQAYAGTGKTHLLRQVMSHASDMTYVAPTAAHGEDIQRFASAGRVISPTAFVNRVSRSFPWQDLGHKAAVMARFESSVSPEQQAKALGIEAAAGISGVEVILLAWRTLSAWAASDSTELTPAFVERAITRDISHSDRKAVARHVCRAAQRLWSAMFAAPSESALAGRLLISHSHLAKWLALHHARIPADLGPLITDEAHDLPGGVLALMERHDQGVVLMGDGHQSLRMNRSPRPGFKLVTIREAVRTGVGPERVINSLIAASGSGLDDEFICNRQHLTGIDVFDARYRPLGVQLWVYGDVQALLEGVLAARDAGESVRVLPASACRAVRVLEGLIRLHQPGGQGSRGWAATAGRNGHKRLRDFIYKNQAAGVRELIQVCSNPNQLARTAVCLVEHAKNIEVQTVAMDVSCAGAGSATRSAPTARAAYQCITRAHGRIWVPGAMLGPG